MVLMDSSFRAENNDANMKKKGEIIGLCGHLLPSFPFFPPLLSWGLSPSSKSYSGPFFLHQTCLCPERLPPACHSPPLNSLFVPPTGHLGLVCDRFSQSLIPHSVLNSPLLRADLRLKFVFLHRVAGSVLQMWVSTT